MYIWTKWLDNFWRKRSVCHKSLELLERLDSRGQLRLRELNDKLSHATDGLTKMLARDCKPTFEETRREQNDGKSSEERFKRRWCPTSTET